VKTALWIVGGAIAGAATMLTVGRVRAASMGRKLVDKLRSVLGTPYIWGGSDPSRGLDCSGAVVWALQQLGLKPKGWDSTAAGLQKQASRVLAPVPGDLAFYGSSGNVSHVMVYAGAGDVIGATGGGSDTKTVADARARGAEVKVVPVTYRSDFLGYGRLPVVAAADAVVAGLPPARRGLLTLGRAAITSRPW